QDQVPLSETNVYANLGLTCEIVSLYGNTEETLAAEKKHLDDLDAIIIDIQDIGLRYYTFSTTMRYLFEAMVHFNIDVPVYVLDKQNPCGLSIEGIPLDALFQSFVGP